VRLGSQDHGKRLKDALDVLDGQRQAGRASQISYIDLSQGKRAIVGLTSGAHRTDDTSSSKANDEPTDQQATNHDTTGAMAEKLTTGASANDDNKAKPENKSLAPKKEDKNKKEDRRNRR
jgi:hypothetical protein